MHKIVFLYSALDGYFLSRINKLTKRKEVEVLCLVSWPVCHFYAAKRWAHIQL
jgi:hypothetical protein